MPRPKQVWKGRIAVDVEYTAFEQAAQDIIRLATNKNTSIHRAARQQFDELLAGFDLASVPFIGEPGGSLEAVTITGVKPVRDWKIVSLEPGD